MQDDVVASRYEAPSGQLAESVSGAGDEHAGRVSGPLEAR